jgi:hypothetical protein
MRLTNDIKDRIVESVLLHRFEKRLKAEAAKTIWESRMTPSGLRLLSTIPKGWLQTSHKISVRLMPDNVSSSEAKHLELQYGGHMSGVGILPSGYKTTTVYNPHPNDWLTVYTINDEDLCKETLDLYEEGRNTLAEVKTARDALGAIREFSTSEKLIAAWPEIEPFVTRHLPPPKPRLPALQTDRLNDLLDLPV